MILSEDWFLTLLVAVLLLEWRSQFYADGRHWFWDQKQLFPCETQPVKGSEIRAVLAPLRFVILEGMRRWPLVLLAIALGAWVPDGGEPVDDGQIGFKFGYDGAGRLIQVIAGFTTADHTVTGYAYDELGNLVAQYDGNQFSANDTLLENAKATRFEYDNLGRRGKRYLPSHTASTTAVESWAYDFAQSGDAPPTGKRINKVHHTDFRDQETVTVYDSLGRVDLKQRWSGSAWTAFVDFDYTATGRRWKMKDAFTASIGPASYVEYGYDDLGRLQTKSLPLDATTTASLTYTYHPSGMLKSITTDKSTCLSHAYDPRNRLREVFTDAGQTALAAEYGYDPVGNLRSVRYGNGVRSQYAYDMRNHLSQIQATCVENPVASFKYDDAAWSQSRRLAYSGQRRRTEENIHGIARTIEYDYDALRRLTKENVLAGATIGPVTYDAAAGYADAAGYDPVGNRRGRASELSGVPARGYAAYDANDRLGESGSGVVRASFDDNGNTQQTDLDVDTNGQWDQAAVDEYDIENQLITARRGGVVIHLLYDGDGHRIKKTAGSTTTYYLVDDRNPTSYAQVLEERSSPSGVPAVRYVYGLDLISQNPGPSVSYYGYDGLGSVRYLTDANGAVTDAYTYDAFGILLESWCKDGNNTLVSVSANDPRLTPNAYRFTGEQWDQDLGLYYLRARYYSPELGRFWTMDSYEGNQEDPLSIHKYLYCHDNPTGRIDPSGSMDLNSTLSVIGNMGYMVANLGIRATPFISRATVFLFEATTGNSVFVGGAGAIVVLKQGGRLGGVGWATWQRVGNLLRGSAKVGTYDELAAGIRGNAIGEAANHLNQAKAFPQIPYGEGVSIVMGGPTSRVRTQHNALHQVLEDFWEVFRTGARRGQNPSNGEYDAILKKALEAAGQASDEADELVKLAREARRAFRYFDGPGGLPPEVPARMPLAR